MKLIEVKFLKSASCAPYFLAYNAGHLGHVTPEMAERLEADGVIEPVSSTPAAPAKPKAPPQAEEEPKVATKDGAIKTKPARGRGRRKHK